MAEYEIQLIRTIWKKITVEADNEDEACDLAENIAIDQDFTIDTDGEDTMVADVIPVGEN